MNKKKLKDVLNIADTLEENIPDPIVITPEEFNTSENHDDDIREDYKFIRGKLRYIVAASEEVLKYSLIDVSQNPTARSVEGASLIIRTICDCTDRLLEIHGKIKKMTPPKTDTVVDDDGNPKIKSTLNDIIKQFKNDTDKTE